MHYIVFTNLYLNASNLPFQYKTWCTENKAQDRILYSQDSDEDIKIILMPCSSIDLPTFPSIQAVVN